MPSPATPASKTQTAKTQHVLRLRVVESQGFMTALYHGFENSTNYCSSMCAYLAIIVVQLSGSKVI